MPPSQIPSVSFISPSGTPGALIIPYSITIVEISAWLKNKIHPWDLKA